MATYKAQVPGVYVQEINAFPNAVVPVETAVPVFIGYTEQASINGRSLTGQLFRISSFAEYVQYFGNGYRHQFGLKNAAGSTAPAAVLHFSAAMLLPPAEIFYCYHSIRLFYQNGGSDCYIFSLGNYEGNGTTDPVINANDLVKQDVFAKLEQAPEPTLVVLPDFVNDRTVAYPVYTAVLEHCGKMQSRFGIFDVIPASGESVTDTCQAFRDAIGNESLKYGVAYYPWLQAAIVQDSEISFCNLAYTTEDLKIILPEKNVPAVIDAWHEANKAVVIPPEETAEQTLLRIEKENINLHRSLLACSPTYVLIMTEIKNRLNLLPPAAAIAGIYSLVDNTRGVWKAPANVSLTSVIAPAIHISADDQDHMNIDTSSGKSINAIRFLPNNGTLVWGAKTLDGNSNDWRYISVCRTISMIEQSVKLACKAFVFEPNVANTWIRLKGMIENFLTSLWQQGALAGAKPEQAFAVQVGLGVTMTADDIVEGNLNVLIMVALARPVEFIEISIQQKLQQS